VRTIVVLAVAALAAPAAASAAPPWSPPRPAEGVATADTLLTTARGDRVLVGASPERSLASPTVLATLGPDGAETGRQRVRIASARATAFGDRIVVAGSRPATTTRGAERAPVLVALGRPGAVGTPRALPGTRGQWVSSLAARGSTVAVVTGTMYGRGAPRRSLWTRRNGRAFRRVITFRPGSLSRDTAVAVGPRGDVLLVWQARRTIRARYFSPSGRRGRVRTLGRGIQSSLQANLASGRMEVAWMSQRVGEGDAHTPARIVYVSAPRGGRFRQPDILGGSSLLGTGNYIRRPGVRLVPAGRRASQLAWTDYDGEHFRVLTAVVGAGVVGTAQRVSAPGDDAVLGDLAVSPGGALVTWSTGTRGNDASGPQHVAAAFRAPDESAFGAPELVSDEETSSAGAAAIDAAGRPLAAWQARAGGPVASVRAGG
jgi:hypothetical protein